MYWCLVILELCLGQSIRVGLERHIMRSVPPTNQPNVYMQTNNGTCQPVNSRLFAQVAMQRKKLLLALQAVKRSISLVGAEHPEAHRMIVLLSKEIQAAATSQANGHVQVRTTKTLLSHWHPNPLYRCDKLNARGRPLFCCSPSCKRSSYYSI